MRIFEAAGARGMVIDAETMVGIPGATVCSTEIPTRCVVADAGGRFSLPTKTRRQWEFIMMEDFPDAYQGTFSATAGGYRSATFNAKYGVPIDVGLAKEKR
jgi:hypothetical protein